MEFIQYMQLKLCLIQQPAANYFVIKFVSSILFFGLNCNSEGGVGAVKSYYCTKRCCQYLFDPTCGPLYYFYNKTSIKNRSQHLNNEHRPLLLSQLVVGCTLRCGYSAAYCTRHSRLEALQQLTFFATCPLMSVWCVWTLNIMTYETRIILKLTW